MENKQKSLQKGSVLLKNIAQNQDEYIHALEMSVQLLQREVEHLREHAVTDSIDSKNLKSINKAQNTLRDDFLLCDSKKSLFLKLNEVLTSRFKLIESSIFVLDSIKKIISILDDKSTSTFYEKIIDLEEQGIIDWIIEKRELTFIPDLEDSSIIKPSFLLISPIVLRKKIYGLFISKVHKNENEFSKLHLQQIKSIVEDASMALENILSLSEISNMNKRLVELSKQMIHSSHLASIGELASSIAQDIKTPLQIIKVNFDLFESGVGDTKRRLSIIKEQFEKIRIITERLTELVDNSKIVNEFSELDICYLIDEVLLFSGSQLQRDGIQIEKDFEYKTVLIKGNRVKIEQVILNLLLNSRDLLPEGGIIRIGVYINENNFPLITIADNSFGIPEKDIDRIFDPDFSTPNSEKRGGMSLFLTKKIIEEHNGKISVVSETGKGLTFKIYFPSLMR